MTMETVQNNTAVKLSDTLCRRMSDEFGISALSISSDATFSDLRNAYRKLPIEFRKESSPRDARSEKNILVRLLQEFLHDPDIQARWNAEDSGSIQEPEGQIRN